MVSNDTITIGDIVRECNTTSSRAKYAIETYRIEPRGRVGIIRIWSREEDLPRIKSALARIAGGRGFERVAC